MNPDKGNGGGRGIEVEFPLEINDLERPFNTADIAKLCKYYKRKSSNDFGV